MKKAFAGLNKLKSVVLFDNEAIYLIDRENIENHFKILTAPLEFAE